MSSSSQEPNDSGFFISPPFDLLFPPTPISTLISSHLSSPLSKITSSIVPHLFLTSNSVGASYHTRKSFRRHLLEKEFADDYSLNPKNSHHNISATSNALSESAHRMTSIIQLKREQSIEKHSNFHQSRQQTALLDPELLLQTAIQKSFNDKMETDYEELMERYQRGDHIFKHHIQQEHNDIHLESTLYTNAASILSSSEVGKITKTYTKQDSKHYNQLKKLEQKEFKSKQQTLDKLKKRLDLYAEYLSGKTTSGQLEEIITELESKIEILTLEIENKKEEDDFDWLLERHNQIRKYKSELIVHREDLFHSQSCHEKIYQKICHQYPEMKDMLSLGILDIHEQKQMILQQLQAQAQAQSQTQSQTMTMTGSGLGKTLGSSTGVATTTTTTTAAGGGGAGGGAGAKGATGVPPPQIRMINASGEEISLVYGWIVGKLNLDGRITHLLFGQFTESDVPPSNGWIPLAKVIPVDSQNFLTVPNETVSSKSLLPSLPWSLSSHPSLFLSFPPLCSTLLSPVLSSAHFPAPPLLFRSLAFVSPPPSALLSCVVVF
jgi:hypothetical protein